MYEAIDATKDIIYKNVSQCKMVTLRDTSSKYRNVYAGTNENIDGYMSQLNFQGKDRILSVMSSGDHPFNAAMNGIKHIDTFDSNALTEYYALGIKRSAILAFDYNNYIQFMNRLFDKQTSLDEICDLINLIYPYMDSKYRYYWQCVMNYNYSLQKGLNRNYNVFDMLLININKIEGVNNNSYLKDENNYNQLRNIIKDIDIIFKCCDCLDVPKTFNHEYDFIFLSNIADYLYINFGQYWGYDKLNNLANSFTKLLKEDGNIALAYVYHCYIKRPNKYVEFIISSSKIRTTDLINEDIITFPYIYKNQIEPYVDSGLILRKK